MEQFDSIEQLLLRLKKDIPRNPLGTVEGRDEYEWIDGGDDDGVRIIPSLNSPFISPYLYRGQTRRYSPCFPALYRAYCDFPGIKRPGELPSEKRDAYLLGQVRLMEFLLTLERHPAMVHAREIGLHVNHMALAQHYGMPTDLMDLTQDHEVALFFASCIPNESGEWYPVTEGIGVVYRIDITAFSEAMVEKMFEILEMIGLQTLPRPGEQKAWTLKLLLGFDFERLPIDIFTFRHIPESAETIAKKFNFGHVLFPPDVLSDIGKQIRAMKYVPRKLVERVLLEHNCNPDLVKEALKTYSRRFIEQFSVSVTDRDLIAMTSEQQRVAQEFVDANKDDFLKRVGVRPVYPAKTQ